MSNGRTRLPVNCVDKCLLALDAIDERMVPHIFLDLDGDVDADRLKKAIVTFLKAHPIMRSHLCIGRWQVVREVHEDLADIPLTVEDVSDGTYDKRVSEWVRQPLDLENEFPFKVLLLRRDRQRSTLVFSIHHMAADGLGMALLILEVIEYYNNGSPDTITVPEGYDNLRNGDEVLRFARSRRPSVQRYYRKMLIDLFRRFFMAAFLPPARVYHDMSGGSGGIGYCFQDIEAADFGIIRSRTKASGVTVNDLLLAACYRVIEKWNSDHGKGSNHIRIMTPVYIGPKGPKQVVSNHASWISLVTTPGDRKDPAVLLRKVRAKMASIFDDAIPYALVYYFYLCSRFPLGVMKAICRFLMISRTYVDSILLSNVGVIWPQEWGEFQMGTSRVADLTVLPPVVSPQGVGIVAYTYSGRLQICLGYKEALFSREKAESFLESYVDHIRRYPGVGVSE